MIITLITIIILASGVIGLIFLYDDFIGCLSGIAVYYNGKWYWWSSVCTDYLEEYREYNVDLVDKYIDIVAWMPLPEPYRESEPHKQTKADEIRSMTDEELAAFIINFDNRFGEEYEGEQSCLSWLQKESEE